MLGKSTRCVGKEDRSLGKFVNRLFTLQMLLVSVTYMHQMKIQHGSIPLYHGVFKEIDCIIFFVWCGQNNIKFQFCLQGVPVV